MPVHKTQPDFAQSLWLLGDRVATTSFVTSATATLTLNSGQPYLVGGPGMVVPAGSTVRSITFISNVAGASLTGQWFFLATPDPTGGSTATVVAVSKNDGSAAWGPNTAKTLSLVAADGGSGEWTPSVDTAVYGGIVQVATTPATIRGLNPSGQLLAITKPRWWATGPGSQTTPYTVGATITLADASMAPVCALSSVAP